MADDIIALIERSRSQIEAKFSNAGSVLEGALALIGLQLESLQGLNRVLDRQSVDDATRDLVATSDYLNALPKSLSVRNARLSKLEQAVYPSEQQQARQLHHRSYRRPQPPCTRARSAHPASHGDCRR